MKYVVEMGSVAMTYIPSFINTGLDVRKFIRRDTQTERWSHKPTFILSK
jgi:hypothetical protein